MKRIQCRTCGKRLTVTRDLDAALCNCENPKTQVIVTAHSVTGGVNAEWQDINADGSVASKPPDRGEAVPPEKRARPAASDHTKCQDTITRLEARARVLERQVARAVEQKAVMQEQLREWATLLSENFEGAKAGVIAGMTDVANDLAEEA
jgi:hypothetical protein